MAPRRRISADIDGASEGVRLQDLRIQSPRADCVADGGVPLAYWPALVYRIASSS